MKTRVIVEGPDGAGKSRLVERLVEHTGLPVMPRASDSRLGPVPDLKKYIEDDLLNHDSTTAGIFDRHPLVSELIYGPIIRSVARFSDLPDDVTEPGWTTSWLTEMLNLFYSYHPVLIYCLPPYMECWKNVQRGTQMVGVKKNIRKIYELYHIEYCRNADRFRVWAWDYTMPDNYFLILNDIERTM